MKTKELRLKQTEELTRLYNELCQKRQQLNFKVANKQLKNVRELRKVKKTMATILTLFQEAKKRIGKSQK